MQALGADHDAVLKVMQKYRLQHLFNLAHMWEGQEIRAERAREMRQAQQTEDGEWCPTDGNTETNPTVLDQELHDDLVNEVMTRILLTESVLAEKLATKSQYVSKTQLGP